MPSVVGHMNSALVCPLRPDQTIHMSALVRRPLSHSTITAATATATAATVASATRLFHQHHRHHRHSSVVQTVPRSTPTSRSVSSRYRFTPYDPTTPTTGKIPSSSSSLLSPLARSQQLSAHFSTSSSSTMSQQNLPSRGGFDPNAGAGRFTARRVGVPHTLEHRIYIERDGIPLSPFHDVPLYANEQQTVLNMVVEIPRWTNAKQEVHDMPPTSSSSSD